MESEGTVGFLSSHHDRDRRFFSIILCLVGFTNFSSPVPVATPPGRAGGMTFALILKEVDSPQEVNQRYAAIVFGHVHPLHLLLGTVLF